MKKLILIALAVLVAPAMADVTITVTDLGEGIAEIGYVVDGDQAGLDGSDVAGIALDVSVDAGSILEVAGFKVGESTDLDKGYGIFPGTINIVAGEVVDDGTPVAAGLPDNPDQPGEGTQAIVLEFGALWDQRPEIKTPPLASGVLCTIAVSDTCLMTVGYNATRGKAVMLGGAAIDDAMLIGAVDVPIVIELGDVYTGPDQQEWIDLGKPASWANPRQCHGDTDGVNEDTGWSATSYVYNLDIAAFVVAYGEALGSPNENLATDFNHAAEDRGWNVMARTGDDDIAALVKWYKEGDVPDDCNSATPVVP